jgi:hypothetical protein
VLTEAFGKRVKCEITQAEAVRKIVDRIRVRIEKVMVSEKGVEAVRAVWTVVMKT